MWTKTLVEVFFIILVINDRFVLTARHCLGGRIDRFFEGTEVLLHAHVLSQKTPPGIPENGIYKLPEMLNFPIHASVLEEDRDEKSQRIKIAEVLLPEVRTWDYYDYDVALLRLERKIDLGQPDGPTPVCLPPADEHDIYTNSLMGHVLTVIGWGYTETGNQSHVLKKANIPYVPEDECRTAIMKNSGGDYDFITRRMLCAYAQNEDSVNDGPCKGDSGGPLFFKNEVGQAVQVGINSFIVGGCPANGTISVYAKLSELMQWIEYHSNDWSAKWCHPLNEN